MPPSEELRNEAASAKGPCAPGAGELSRRLAAPFLLELARLRSQGWAPDAQRLPKLHVIAVRTTGPGALGLPGLATRLAPGPGGQGLAGLPWS